MHLWRAYPPRDDLCPSRMLTLRECLAPPSTLITPIASGSGEYEAKQSVTWRHRAPLPAPDSIETPGEAGRGMRRPQREAQ